MLGVSAAAPPHMWKELLTGISLIELLVYQKVMQLSERFVNCSSLGVMYAALRLDHGQELEARQGCRYTVLGSA